MIFHKNNKNKTFLDLYMRVYIYIYIYVRILRFERRKIKIEKEMIIRNEITIISTSPCFNLPSLAATLSGCTTDITVRFPSGCKLNPNRLFQPRVSSTMNTFNNNNYANEIYFKIFIQFFQFLLQIEIY